MTSRVYLAAPLFTPEERKLNLVLADLLQETYEVFLPQRDGTLLTTELAKGVEKTEAYNTVFQKDVDAIRSCEIVFAVLNGRSVDEGVAVELGIGYALGKRCWGFKTDPRQLLSVGDNPMIEGLLEKKLECLSDVKAAIAIRWPYASIPSQ